MHGLVHEGEGDEVDESESEGGQDGVAVTCEPKEARGSDDGSDEQEPVVECGGMAAALHRTDSPMPVSDLRLHDISRRRKIRHGHWGVRDRKGTRLNSS